MPDFLKDNTFLVTIAALGTAVAAFWGQIKSVISVLRSLMIVTISIESYPTVLLASQYLRVKTKVYGERSYQLESIYNPSELKNKWKFFPSLANKCICFLGRVPLFVTRPGKTYNENQEINISFIRGTIDKNILLKDFEDFCNSRMIHSFKVIRMTGMRAHIGHSSSAHGAPPQQPQDNLGFYKTPIFEEPKLRKSDSLSFTPKMEAAVREATKWFESKEWFESRNIPWRRGWLIRGNPGNGKSSLAKAIAERLNIPLILIDLASMGNAEFISAWKDCSNYGPCIILIEDIDTVFEERKNVVKGEFTDKLDFACFINTIDGVQSTNGIFLMITTNDMSKIDHALASLDDISSRPGRIDRVIHLDGLDLEGYRKISNRILGHEDKELVQEAVTSKMSPAKFQEICIRHSIKEFYDESKEEIS